VDLLRRLRRFGRPAFNPRQSAYLIFGRVGVVWAGLELVLYCTDSNPTNTLHRYG